MRVTCRDVTGLRAPLFPRYLSFLASLSWARSEPQSTNSSGCWQVLCFLQVQFCFKGYECLCLMCPAGSRPLSLRSPAVCPRPQSPVCRVCPEFAERLSCPRSLFLSRTYFQSLAFRTWVFLVCPYLAERETGFDCGSCPACTACPVHRACLGSLPGPFCLETLPVGKALPVCNTGPLQ